MKDSSDRFEAASGPQRNMFCCRGSEFARAATWCQDSKSSIFQYFQNLRSPGWVVFQYFQMPRSSKGHSRHAALKYRLPSLRHQAALKADSGCATASRSHLESVSFRLRDYSFSIVTAIRCWRSHGVGRRAAKTNRAGGPSVVCFLSLPPLCHQWNLWCLCHTPHRGTVP